MGPSRSIFYYVSVYTSDFFPWSLLSFAAIYQLWRTRKKEQPMKSLSFGLPVIWCFLVFIVFSLSKNKQEYYIAPLYPAAAVVLSGLLDKRVFKRASGEIGQDKGETRMPSEAPAAIESIQSWQVWTYGVMTGFILILSVLMPYILGALIPDASIMLQFTPSLILVAGMGLLIRSVVRREYTKCFSTLAVPIWAIFVLGALYYIPALESARPVKSFCRQIEMQWHDRDEAGFFRSSLPSMVFYLRRPIFQENSYERMMARFSSDKRVFCILSEKDYAYFANQGLNIYILDRHSRFGMRLGDLMNTSYFKGDDLLLVSNRLPTKNSSGEGRSRS
jgi:4-amino-4-deoxy-L-arabinose transferase-like glycosyltransferase